MLWLSRADVEGLGLGMPEVVDIVAHALAEKASGRVEMPPKLGLSPHPGAVLHAMPARVGDAVGMKWIAVVPQNRGRGLPQSHALLVLNDAQTGAIEAVLEASWITEMRTAAVAAVAARTLARPQSEVLAVIGPGALGRRCVAALKLALPRLRLVRAWAPRPETAQRFARDLAGTVQAEAAPSAAQAVRGADVIVTSAPWPGGPPGIEADWLAGGVFACALDYDASFTPEAAAAFDRRFADDVPQMEVARAKRSFPGWPAFAELSTGRRGTPQQRILCACLGLALFDVAVGRRALEVARQRNAGRYLP